MADPQANNGLIFLREISGWISLYVNEALASAFALFFDLFREMQMLTMNTLICCRRIHS